LCVEHNKRVAAAKPEGIAYSYTITASGGNPAEYNWSISEQPSWLSIEATTGKLSGTPPAGSAGNTYTFTVSVTDGQQTASKQFELVVKQPPPTADFVANVTIGTAPLTVTFIDKSVGTVTQWQWDFDNDGVTDSTDKNPIWAYTSPGWYTVRLTVSDGVESSTCVKDMYILVASGIYYVDGVNGDDMNSGANWSDAFATIGKALTVAGDYDLVFVADATYREIGLQFNGKKIYLKGVDHNTAGGRPVIDCHDSGRAFCFYSGEGEDSVVDNFTIQNGSAQYGGAVRCKNSSSPTIRNCVFTGNRSSDYGGAICCEGSSDPAIVDCIFSSNDSWYGGAIYCNSSSPTIINCVFSDNSSCYGGAIYCRNSSLTVTNCVFSGNSATAYGGALRCYSNSNSTITNCTFSSNSADYGGAVACYSANATLNNCILWGNSALFSGDEVYVYDVGSSCTLNYCCVNNTGYGGQTGGITENNCIYDDPQFVDAANGDYHLKDTSPCIDAGDNSLLPSGVDKDLDGNPRIVNGTVDIGAYEKQ